MLSDTDRQIFTIGHSDHSAERFIELLCQHRVSAIVDVRSSPYGRFHTHFNRDQIRAVLKSQGISYVFLGEELGARRRESECYVDGKAMYELISKLPLFRKGLQRVRNGVGQHRIALMCAEKDPITCHRTILVCRHLKADGVPISHILEGGDLETTAEMEQRLLEVAGTGAELFVSDRDALLEHAFDVQGERIAFTERAVAAEERG